LALVAGVGGGVIFYAYHSDRFWRSSPSTSTEQTGETVSPPRGIDEPERAYLWDIEHHGLVLSRHGFQRLADALARADAQALLALLAPDFTGQTLQQPREVCIAKDYVQGVRQEDAGHPPVVLNRASFHDRLLEYRRLFARPPKVQLALMALAPTVRGDLTSPWQGTCQLRMWGEMPSVGSDPIPQAAPNRMNAVTPNGPGEVVLYLQYQVPRPTEKKLRQGGWLHSCAITQSQIARSPRFLLREAAAERGIDRRRFHDNWEHGMKGTTTGGVYLCDYDRDGILDMLVVDLNGIALYKGLPDGKFVDVTQEVGLPWRLLDPVGANLVAAFVDLDGDGWEDLILNKRIYRNEGGQRFQDVTHLSNLRLQGDISGIAVADYDRDGRLDLYVARLGPSKASSWLDGKCGGHGGNLLFRNQGNWQFEEVAVASGATGGDRSTFTAIWFDANNDGWPDLYVLNEFGNGVLLINQGNGTFREQALVSGPGDFGSMGATAGDIDNDGNIDLYVANMYSKAGRRVIGNLAPGTYSDGLMATLRSFVAGSQLHRNRGNLQFEQLGQKYQVAAVGWAYGPALVDLDNDGWLDLYATAGFVSQNRQEPDG
jgi:hypothetical protein